MAPFRFPQGIQCIVLAGGLGTRMRPMTETVPKVLLTVLDRPFLAWQLDLLFRTGVGSVVLSVGYKGEMVQEFLDDHGPFPGPVELVFDGDELLGTGGAIRRALDLGALGDRFLVTYGDSYLPIDFGDVWKTFERSGKPALMSVFENAGHWDTSNVDYGEGVVRLYDKKRTNPPPGGFRFIDYGLSALDAKIVREFWPSGAKGDLAEMFNATSLRGDLAGYEAPERFYEIGSPQGLRDLEGYLGGRVLSSAPHGPTS
ncbi:MAG: NTP transferase domain-containing protein [Polyangiaceae bacterium]